MILESACLGCRTTVDDAFAVVDAVVDAAAADDDGDGGNYNETKQNSDQGKDCLQHDWSAQEYVGSVVEDEVALESKDWVAAACAGRPVTLPVTLPVILPVTLPVFQSLASTRV